MIAPVQALSEREHRIPVLDGLRATSILLVLAAHLLPLGPKAWQLNATAGPMGMGLFFVLSGFLIVTTLRGSTWFDFIVKRAARLLPLFLLYMAIVAVLFAMPADAVLLHVLFVVNYFPQEQIPQTEHLWSLCVEWHFYLGMALLVAFAPRAVLVVWPACLAITLVRIASEAPISIATHLRIDDILIGACIATLKLPRRGSSWLWIVAAAIWVVTCHPASGALQYLRPYATGFLFVTVLTAPQGALTRVLTSRPMAYIATISYALYIFHPLTAHGWWNAGTVWERYLFKRPLCLAITFALAHLSTFWWERWWMRAARDWLAASAARRPTAAGSGEAARHR